MTITMLLVNTLESAERSAQPSANDGPVVAPEVVKAQVISRGPRASSVCIRLCLRRAAIRG
jgi:hypothetical protein